MTAPASNLGPNSQPWGRWVDTLEDANARAIESIRADSRSAGMQFRSLADNMEHQIVEIPSVSSISELTIPSFSVSRSFSPTARLVYDSPTITVNPPRLDQPYTVTVVANMHATGVMFPYSDSLLRVNGVDFMFSHENESPSFVATPYAEYSIMGTGSVMGAPVTLQFAISTSAAGTVTFSNTQIWCIFSGSIL